MIVTAALPLPAPSSLDSFAVLAGTTVTNAGDGTAALAQRTLTSVDNNLAGRVCGTDLSGEDLGGMTLTPGVYCFDTSAELTGTLTLNGQGSGWPGSGSPHFPIQPGRKRGHHGRSGIPAPVERISMTRRSGAWCRSIAGCRSPGMGWP